MGIDFNADDIFEMAERIEINGANFYRAAAKNATKENCKMLLELADMEDQHKKIFADMRAGLSESERGTTLFDPFEETAAYLKSIADGHIFDVKNDPAKKLTGNKSIKDILKTAIGMEKDSIVFYIGLKDVVPERLGKGKLDNIIKEEMGHITLLSGKLSSVK